MKRNTFYFASIPIVLTLALQLCVSISSAQWSGDPTVNTPVCVAVENQSVQRMISDGTYGAMIAWTDYRNGNGNCDVYAQRIDDMGVARWTADGVPVCAAPNNQYLRGIVSDGVGGAIVVWVDYRNGSPNCDIYAQRYSTSGAMLWAVDGVPVSTGPNQRAVCVIVADGAGGAIIPFGKRSGWFDDIYAQRIDANGQTVWASDIPISTASGNQYVYGAVSDNAGGTIVVWLDDHNWPHTDIYAQRVDGLGEPQWAQGGILICTYPCQKLYVRVASDGAGGAIITWQDQRSYTGPPEIYAQRINILGQVQWSIDGVPVCAGKNSSYPMIVSDGKNGAIIAWQDARSGSTYDIYAQRIDGSGAAQWLANGRLIGKAASFMIFPVSDRLAIVGDRAGGAIAVWHDSRQATDRDLFAQRVSVNGDTLWGNSVVVCSAPNAQTSPQVLCDSVGDAIITWVDSRSGPTADIYTQYVDPFGNLGKIPPNERVGLLIANVHELVESETLNEGEGTALESKLRNAKKNLEAGRATPAVNQLHAFTNQVHAFINSGRLQPTDGQPLIDKGKRIAAQVVGISKEAGSDQRSQQSTPSAFALDQNYPNPFNPRTEIGFRIADFGLVSLKVFDMLGREVATPVNEVKQPGVYTVQWDATGVASGVYFYRLDAGGFAKTKRMVLMK